MNDLGGNLGPLRQPYLRQVVRQEISAAADVIEREFSPIGLRAIAAAAQIPDVMEQRQDHAGGGALRGQLALGFDLAFVAGEQSRHRQRDIERVLPIVIDRVDTGKSGHTAGKQRIEIGKCALHRGHDHVRPGGDQQLLDRAQHRLRRADPHRVCDVIVAAADVGHVGAKVSEKL